MASILGFPGNGLHRTRPNLDSHFFPASPISDHEFRIMNTQENQRGTVLIVDDIPNNLKILLTYLDRLHFKVLVAQDGEDGLAKAIYAKPDVILLDIMMPRMDGYETCRRIKEHPETHEIPVIFMSALSDVNDKIRGFEAGAVDYITKPVQHQEVLARLTTHITLRNLQRTLEQRNHELSMMAHTLVRDFKVPLLSVGLFARVLRAECGQSNGDIEGCFQQLQATYEQINNNLEAVLLLMNLRGPDACHERVAMDRVFERVMERFSHLRPQFLNLGETPEAWPSIRCNPFWSEDVWAGLLVFLLATGDSPNTLRIRARATESQGFFYLNDNGPPFTAEQEARLFQRDQDNHHNPFGLSVIQRLVARCEGHIGVDREQFSTGRTLFFSLPVAVD